MYGLLVCAISILFVGAHALVGTTCLTEDECDAGECCQILSEFQVVSKRVPKTGTCQLYRLEGAFCDSLEKINGYCGCGPGLNCHTYEVPVATVAPAGTKRDIMPARPGYYWVSKCEKT